MLIFQINQNELKNDLTSKDWLFWNTYLQSRIQEDDYVLLPAYINYIQDTNMPIDNGNVLLVEADTEDDDSDEINT